jgi:leader peptidase (prepilin peptidase)/N-methyltransferase
MTALLALSAVFGLLIGSFLNVVIYRVPARMSVISPPSACPGCGARIAWYDNIPLLSWLALRGVCRSCATAISWRHPLVELGTAVLFVLAATQFGPAMFTATTGAETASVVLVLVAFLYLSAITVALALIDIDVHKLPNALVLPAYAVGLVLLGAASILGGDYAALIRGGIGMAVLFAAYFVMAFAYPGGMGLGDVKLAGVLGLFLGYLGWGEFAVGALAAFLLGGVYAVALLVTRRAGRKSGIPFGPWMLAGAWVGIFFGGALWGGYLSLFGLA